MKALKYPQYQKNQNSQQAMTYMNTFSPPPLLSPVVPTAIAVVCILADLFICIFIYR